MTAAAERQSNEDLESPASDGTVSPKKRTPLPKAQLFIVLLIQFCEPISAGVIYPFMPQFVRDTGITRGDEAKVGHYAGIIVRAVSTSSFGRRPNGKSGIGILLWGMRNCVLLGDRLRCIRTPAHLVTRTPGTLSSDRFVWLLENILASGALSVCTRRFQWQYR